MVRGLRHFSTDYQSCLVGEFIAYVLCLFFLGCNAAPCAANLEDPHYWLKQTELPLGLVGYRSFQQVLLNPPLLQLRRPQLRAWHWEIKCLWTLFPSRLFLALPVRNVNLCETHETNCLIPFFYIHTSARLQWAVVSKCDVFSNCGSDLLWWSPLRL